MKIFITGISSGIGKALAQHLLQQGHEVWGIARREGLLKQFEQEARTEKLKWSVCDAGDREQVRRVKARMKEKNFIPQICILNAGVSRYDSDAPVNPSLCDELIGSNLQGVIHCMDIFNDDIQSRQGQFVLISSIFALIPDSRNPVYSAGKAGASMLTRALRLNEKWRGIGLKNVYLGPVRTDRQRESRFFIPPVESAARFIADRVIPADRGDFFYPFAARLACMLFLLLPDSIFDRLASTIRRK